MTECETQQSRLSYTWCQECYDIVRARWDQIFEEITRENSPTFADEIHRLQPWLIGVQDIHNCIHVCKSGQVPGAADIKWRRVCKTCQAKRLCRVAVALPRVEVVLRAQTDKECRAADVAAAAQSQPRSNN